jgi:hypothetical protein
MLLESFHAKGGFSWGLQFLGEKVQHHSWFYLSLDWFFTGLVTLGRDLLVYRRRQLSQIGQSEVSDWRIAIILLATGFQE